MTSNPPDEPTYQPSDTWSIPQQQGNSWTPPAEQRDTWSPPQQGDGWQVPPRGHAPQPSPGQPDPSGYGYGYGYRPAPGGQPYPGGQPMGGQPMGGQPYPGYYPPMASVGGPSGPVGPRPRDGFSLAAFILGIIAIFPLAFIFGIVGIVRTKARQRKGRWMAVSGMVLGIGWFLGIVALIAVAVSQAPQRSAVGAVTKSGKATLSQLRVGDCLKVPTGPTQRFRRLPDVPCDQPHNAQVFTKIDLPGSSYPGQANLERQGLAACNPPGQAYMATSTVRLRLLVLAPEAATWDAGNHQAVCAVVDPTGNRSGDLRKDR